MKTAAGLIEHCKKALKEQWQYVYGAKAQVLSLAQIKALKNEYGSMVWQSDLQKAGRMCCDCSGLISSYTGIERSSSNYKDSALATVSIGQLKADWEKYVGWGLWLSGHIGVVSDTKGYYYAMDGSARNMVHNPLNKQAWICAIKLKDIDYGEVKKMEGIDEVKKILGGLEKRVEALEAEREKVFNSLDEVPDWGRKTVEKLVEKGVLKGDGDGFKMSYSMLRVLVVCDRAGGIA